MISHPFLINCSLDGDFKGFTVKSDNTEKDSR